MAIATHVIFGAYGFWLPNDPRGSWSQFVGSWTLSRFGEATKVSTCRSLAHVPHNRDLRREAKLALKHPAAVFTGQQALAIGRGFAAAKQQAGYTLLACAILPEHVHLVILRHRHNPARIVGHLKARATERLREQGLWESNRPVWAERCWKVYLDDLEAVARAIEYVAANPEKEGKPRQHWSFVTPWPLA